MSGRARGRGAARGRGGPTATPAEDVRRPGGGASATVQQVPHQGPGEAAPAVPSNGAGRASLRGGARGDQRPGAGVADVPVTQMASLSVGTGDASERRGRAEISYGEACTRPAHITDKSGTSGKPLAMLTNYFRVEQAPGWQLYQYHVDYQPPVDSRKFRRGLIHDHKSLFGLYTFDGMQLYTATCLPDEVTEVFSFGREKNDKFKLVIRRVAELSPRSPTCLHIFNILLRQFLDLLGMKEVQRAYFNPSLAIKVQQHKLEVWPGFKTSILQYEDSIMLNVDVSHKVLRTDSVLDFMYDLNNRLRGGSNFRDECTRKLVGLIVLTRYNDKTYRIDDIEWDIKPTMTFKKRDEEITYVKYYKTAHDVVVRDLEQPMLVSRPKKKDQREGAPEILYLLPELCTMTGLTDEMRANFTVMKDLDTHTKVDPSKRADTMGKLMGQMKSNPDIKAKMTGWGLKFSDGLVNLNGRVLDSEMINLGVQQGNVPKTVNAGRQADWGRDMRGRLYTPMKIERWVVIYHNKNEGVVNDFLQSLSRVTPAFGMKMGPPVKACLQNDSINSFLEAIRANVGPTLQMVVAVLPTNKKDRYDAIKKQCCIDSPVPSQCITANVLRKPKGLMSVVSKVAIQMNVKLGGEAWTVPVPLKKMMVIGIDTYHDSAKKGRSVGGFVASLNASLTRYYSQTTFQHNAQELSDQLKMCMNAALKKYHSINSELPERIVIYRDGVGEGQEQAVVDYEFKQLLDAIKTLGEEYKPKVTLVLVVKRINTRFMAKGQGLSNPPPGTIIDNTVTKAERYDFFVVSQSVRQGTVSPTYYNVCWDTSGMKPDHLQRLTYKLCHLYYNWPGTIRVPAPCQYAHKLAFLVGQSIHKAPDLSLADKLYYL